MSIVDFGYVVYLIEKNDLATEKLMKDSVSADSQVAKRMQIAASIDYEDYFATIRLGTHLNWFEGIFREEGAVPAPLTLITMIDDGIPKVDLSRTHDPFTFDELEEAGLTNSEIMVDYLKKYTSESGFDVPRLVHDDYFIAIKMLFNAKLYISGAKLIFSCIDSLAFIEYGDVPRNFQQWLDTYADLASHDITSDELWELRNSLLHMTNLDSRKVAKGIHPAIIMHIGELSDVEKKAVSNVKFLDIYKFYKTTANAISNWCKSYNANPEKLESFVKRYDLTISDSRLAKVEISTKEGKEI